MQTQKFESNQLFVSAGAMTNKALAPATSFNGSIKSAQQPRFAPAPTKMSMKPTVSFQLGAKPRMSEAPLMASSTSRSNPMMLAKSGAAGNSYSTKAVSGLSSKYNVTKSSAWTPSYQ